MDLTSFTKYGIEVFAIAAIVFIVVRFLQHLKEQREGFTTTINNHMEHNTRAVEQNTKATAELGATNKELCIYIKALNGKKKK